METKKYKLTEETTNVYGRILHRIEALRDFNDVKKGDKGGYVEKEDNLSQEGDCWIYDHTKVYDNAVVCGNAKVYGNADVYGNARIYDNAKVSDKALVFGNAEVYCKAKVSDYAYVCGDALVCDKAKVSDYAYVFGNAYVCDNAEVYCNAIVFGNAYVCDNAEVFGNAKVFGNAIVYDNAEICSDAEIKNSSDYIVFKNWWSSGRFFTWTRSNNMWKVGCFYGTGEQLINKAYGDSELSGREYERVVKYVESIIKDCPK